MLIDEDYLDATVTLLREIVLRLETLVGPVLMKRWFKEASAGSWEQDCDDYSRLKLLSTCLQSRPRDLPEVTEANYQADASAV